MFSGGAATLGFSIIDVFNYQLLLGINIGILILVIFKYYNALLKYIETKEKNNKKEKSK